MGNSTIWYYPTETRAIDIDFGRRLAQRQGPKSVFRMAGVESLTGAVEVTTFGGRAQLRLQHRWDTRGSGSDLHRKLRTLWNHLQRGGHLMYADDASYAYAAFCTVLPGTRATQLSVGPNLFAALAAGVTPLSRELVIQSDPDAFMSEMRLCNGFLADTYIGLSGSTVFPYHANARWVLAREEGSFPALRVPLAERNAEPVVSDRNVLFDLDLPLEEDPEVLEALTAATVGGTSNDTIDPPVVIGGTTGGFDPTVPPVRPPIGWSW